MALKQEHKQALRDLTDGIPACDALTDEQFFSMLDEAMGGDETPQSIGTGDTDTLNAIAGIAVKYQDDPRWQAFLEKVKAGPDLQAFFETGADPREQFDALVAALPKDEQEAGQRLEDALTK